jgi:pseudouridine-5'-phosphate glycosidase
MVFFLFHMTDIALIENNALVGAQIAVEYGNLTKQ